MMERNGHRRRDHCPDVAKYCQGCKAGEIIHMHVDLPGMTFELEYDQGDHDHDPDGQKHAR